VSANEETWDRRYFSLAMEIAGWSKDSTKVGAICIAPDRRQMVAGYNGFPRNILDTDERLANKVEKNRLTVHAEANVVINATVLLNGWTLYVTKAPCTDCAKLLINADLARIVMPNPGGSWLDSQLFAISLFTEANIIVSFL